MPLPRRLLPYSSIQNSHITKRGFALFIPRVPSRMLFEPNEPKLDSNIEPIMVPSVTFVQFSEPRFILSKPAPLSSSKSSSPSTSESPSLVKVPFQVPPSRMTSTFSHAAMERRPTRPRIVRKNKY